MNNFTPDYIVDMQEAEALKELIFKRARERAEALSKKANDSYIDSIKNDVMDIARNSFNTNKNPFIKETETSDNSTKLTPANSEVEIGFKQRTNSVREKIQNSHKMLNEHIANYEIMQVMQQTKAVDTNKKSFVGALDFLNAQASISLNTTKGKYFQALA